MVNLRQRVQKPEVPNKRTSSRALKMSNEANYMEEEEVNIDSSDSEDIELSESENDGILDGYISDSNEAEEGEDSFNIEEKDDGDFSGSEDDKEIKRIIEKTEAETRNIPLTARQRAKLAGGLNHPIDLKEADNSTVLTDEQALRKSEKSRRRKLQRDAKIEETKRATIDRLLQKQKKPTAPENQSEGQLDESKDSHQLEALLPGTLRFISNSHGSFLKFADSESLQSFVSGFSAPRQSGHDSLCKICKKNQSKYVHPLNGKSFCSLSCYKLIK